MKKTLTVNLGGTVFNIDDDAYRLLDNYLCNLKSHFSKEEGAEEIVDDIERRISELLAEKLAEGKQVITISDVEEVITRVGKPEEMDQEGQAGEANDAQGGASAQTGAQGSTQGAAHRRLFRNPDDKILGGVISGIAAYFCWDVTLLRLLLLVILICGYGTLIPVYIVCWFLIPEARTAAEKLSMRGEAITVENIGKTVTDGFEKVAGGVNDYVRSGKPRTFFQKLGDTLVRVCGWILKVLLVVAVVCFSPFLLIMAIVLVAIIIAMVAAIVGGGAAFLSIFPATWGLAGVASPLAVLVMYIAAILLICIPLFGLVWLLWSQLTHSKSMNNGLKWTLLILWIVSAACFGFCFANNDAQLPPPFHRLQPSYDHKEWRYDPNAKVGTLSFRRLLIGDDAYNEDAREALEEAQRGLEEAQKDLEEAQREIEEAGEPENEAEKFARNAQRRAIEVSKAVVQKSLEELNADTVRQ